MAIYLDGQPACQASRGRRQPKKELHMEAMFWLFVAAPFVINGLGIAVFMLVSPFVKT